MSSNLGVLFPYTPSHIFGTIFPMQKDFDTWNERKKKIHETNFDDFVHTREVWWCSLGVNIGYEQDGKHEQFERPVLVIKKFNRDSVLIVPITSKAKHTNIYHIVFPHTDKEYSVIISQIRLVSTKRFLRKLYVMNSEVFEKILVAIKSML